MTARPPALLPADAARLMPVGSAVLVACSGGPDSLALLHAVVAARETLGLTQVWAAGVDHGLRPGAATELALAAAHAQRWGVEFTRLPVDVDPAGNILANARRVRYAALAALARRLGASRVALAHQANDQAETVLQRLARGAALGGVGGMAAQRGPWVRPLLGVLRSTIEAYLSSHGIVWAVDPSNADPRRARAQLRATVVPALARMQPGCVGHMERFARLARADERYLQGRASRRLRQLEGPAGCLRQAAFARLPEALGRRVLARWLAARGLQPTQRQIDWLWMHRRSPLARFPGGRTPLVWERGALWGGPRGLPYDRPLRLPGALAVDELGLSLHGVAMPASTLPVAQLLGHHAESVAFDADDLHFELRLRSWRPGDAIASFGGRGRVKVGDVFTDAKLPRALRDLWPLVTCGDQVLWVVGLRRGREAPVRASTRRLVALQVDGALPWPAC